MPTPRKRTTKDTSKAAEDSGKKKPKRGRKSKKDLEEEDAENEMVDSSQEIIDLENEEARSASSSMLVDDLAVDEPKAQLTEVSPGSLPSSQLVDTLAVDKNKIELTQVTSPISVSSSVSADTLAVDKHEAQLTKVLSQEKKHEALDQHPDSSPAVKVNKMEKPKDDLAEAKILDNKILEKVEEKMSVDVKSIVVDAKPVVTIKSVKEVVISAGKKEVTDATSGDTNVAKVEEDMKNTTETSRDKREIKPFQNRYYSKYYRNYYIDQEIIKGDKFDSFMDILYTPLPQTLRFIGNSRFIGELNSVFKREFVSKFKDQISDNELPKCLDWFPNSCLWQWNKKPEMLRESEKENIIDPLVVDMYNFVSKLNKMGMVCQLDMISFLPTITLKVEKHHKVLDMSGNHVKSLQLLQFLNDDNDDIFNAGGFVVNCESILSNCRGIEECMLQMQSPNFAIANLDLRHSPPLMLNDQPLKYDRILSHLNSDNDGLFRCNIEQMQSYDNGLAYRYHSDLCEQLISGLNLLEVGGLLLYSVHSLNPLECEAVVANSIACQNGSVELVDITTDLSMFEPSIGKDTWKVISKNGRMVEAGNYYVPPSMFPPTENTFNLQKCVRIMPNKGIGIFMALLKRTISFEEANRKIIEERETKAKELLKALEEKLAAGKKKTVDPEASKKDKAVVNSDKDTSNKSSDKVIKTDDSKESGIDKDMKDAENTEVKSGSGESLGDASSGNGNELKTIEGSQDTCKSKSIEDKNKDLSADKTVKVKEDHMETSGRKDGQDKEAKKDAVGERNKKGEEGVEDMDIGQETKDDKDIRLGDKITGDLTVAEGKTSGSGKGTIDETSGKGKAEGDSCKDSKVEDKVETGKEKVDAKDTKVVASKNEKQKIDKIVGKTVESGKPPVDEKKEPKKLLEVNTRNNGNKRDFHPWKPESIFLIPELKLFYLEKEDPLLVQIKDFFGMTLDATLMCHRENKQFIFLTSAPIKQLCLANQDRTHFTRTGLKLFVRFKPNESSLGYRFSQESLHCIVPYLTKRIINVSEDDFASIIPGPEIPIENFSAKNKKILHDYENGAIIIVCDLKPKNRPVMMLSAWKEKDKVLIFTSEYQRDLYKMIVNLKRDVKNIDFKETLCAFANRFKQVK